MLLGMSALRAGGSAEMHRRLRKVQIFSCSDPCSWQDRRYDATSGESLLFSNNPRPLRGFSCRSLALSLVLATFFIARAPAQTLSAPMPRQGVNYTFTVGAGATNLSLVVSNNASAYSYLLLKNGGTPTDTVFDYAARLNGVTNEINLENSRIRRRDLWTARLDTRNFNCPPLPGALDYNRADLRSSAYPVLKRWSSPPPDPDNTGPGAWQYFQVDVPSNLLSGWRLVLSTNVPAETPTCTSCAAACLPPERTIKPASARRLTLLFSPAPRRPATPIS